LRIHNTKTLHQAVSIWARRSPPMRMGRWMYSMIYNMELIRNLLITKESQEIRRSSQRATLKMSKYTHQQNITISDLKRIQAPRTLEADTPIPEGGPCSTYIHSHSQTQARNQAPHPE
jgi:hypothetical protein